MWIYEQRTGRLYGPDGTLAGTGYSGHGEHVNKPEDEALVGLGPIPAGRYLIGDEFDSQSHGPVCLPLKPVGHDAHGRSGFLMHGDSRRAPGTASLGCIIQGRPEREEVSASEERELEVVADMVPA